MDLVVAKIIQDDKVSRTASQVVSDATTRGLEYPTSSSQVPAFLTDSISKIFTGNDNADLDPYVCTIYGEALADGQAGIDIKFIPEEQANVYGSDAEDQEPATRYATLQLLCRVSNEMLNGDDGTLLPRDLIRRLDLRLYWLLDYKARQQRLIAGAHESTEDKTLHPDYGLTCHYLRSERGSHALEMLSIYRVEYVLVIA